MRTEQLIAEIITKESKLDLNQALRTLLKNKNWKDIIRKAFETKQSSKEAGIINNALIGIVMFLSTALGATSAEDLISKVEQKAETVQTTPAKSNSYLTKKLEKMLPYPVSKADLLALKTQNPLLGKPLIDPQLFERSLTRKIKDAMKDINPQIKKDADFQGLDDKQIQNLILEAFKNKLQDPKYSSDYKVLQAYLGKQKENINFVYHIVQNALAKTI